MLKIKKIHENAVLPKRAKFGDSGLDLCSVKELVIKPNSTALVPTGWQMEVPVNFEIQIRPRSGLALKKSISVGNSPGTVDANFRGEVCIILRNEGTEDFPVMVGDRIAQMVVAPVLLWEPEVVEELSDTSRGAGGFGSTGV